MDDDVKVGTVMTNPKDGHRYVLIRPDRYKKENWIQIDKGIKLPSFEESMQEELASRGPLEQYNAGWGVPLNQAAYGLKGLFTDLTPQDQQVLQAQKQIQGTIPGMLGSASGYMAATGPAFGRIAGAPAATPVEAGANAVSAGLLGGAVGALTSPGERTAGAKAGFTGSLAGSLAGEALRRGGSFYRESQQPSLVEEVAKKAREAKIKIPPSQTNPTATAKILEGISGKAPTAQQASKANEEAIQKLVAKELDISSVTPASLLEKTKDSLKAYDVLKNQKPFVADDAFVQKMAEIGLKNEQNAKLVPSLLNPEIRNLSRQAQGLGGQPISAEAAVDILRELRFQANANIGSASSSPAQKALGFAQKEAAKALEDLISRNLVQRGSPKILGDFLKARKTLAQIDSVDRAMNQATGQVNALEFGKQLQNKEPLTGNLKKLGEIALTFPKAVQPQKASVLPISPLDAAMAVALGTGGYYVGGSPEEKIRNMMWGLALPVGRAGARSFLLSETGQGLLGTPSYAPANLAPLGLGIARTTQ